MDGPQASLTSQNILNIFDQFIKSAVERPRSVVERPVNNTWKIYKKKIKWDFD